ncbi:FAD-binding domain-containing protein [Aaosphaeria arxii CBS 175.79]|uniref:FAD-binding domain-containing protein n=1 Tax=Aaosphaeria arxii CBS 175.79 TaxID=1450172 RepID=A0A6A5X744_9PLEO|nr:FAD-binding domain-containing protein [Aaosphaeria arxii CBS 175.79]KAF2008706.1 FAD-binding domain-containing protein [Aaosphaeria arxii CBS 175.79]
MPWLLFLVNVVSAMTSANEIADYFRNCLSSGSSVYLTSDPASVNATTPRWDLWSAPTYIVAVKPALRGDVQKVIEYASQKNIPFLTTGGGHGYSGTLGAIKDGIQLDMGNFNTVFVDADKNLMTAGGSLRFRDVAAAAHAKGKSTTIGACSCVGIGGATLGGGIGFYSGLYGAISDSLHSVDIVTGTGELLTASDTENQDLFWGIKGAGFNFGSVTSFTYRVHDQPNGGMVMNADMTFTGAQNASIWEFSKTMLGTQPPELSLVFAMRYDPEKSDIAIIVNAIYAGPLEDGKALLEPLLKLEPTNVAISYIPWKDAPDTAVYGITKMTCASSYTYVPHAINLYDINVEALSELTKHVYNVTSTTPAVQGTLFTFTQYASQGFRANSDANMTAKGRVGSSFPYREPTVFVQIDGLSFDPSSVDALDAFGNEIRAQLLELSGQNHLELYSNFARGDEGAEAWYGTENLPRLQALKARYDPKGLFSFYNPIGGGKQED